MARPRRPKKPVPVRRPRAPRVRRARPDPPDPGLQGTAIQLLRDAQLLRAGYTFDVAQAERVCYFFENFLVHSKGEWKDQPLILEPWQRAPLRRLFGWKRPDGTRRYRKTYWEVPRKNGKSTIGAGVGTFLTTADREGGAEVYSAANDKNQAKIIFKEAKRMVEASPELSSRCRVYSQAIVVPDTLSSYQPISSDSSNKDGLNIHGLVVDELHEWADRDFWEKLTSAQGSRRQPLTAIFTTAGYDPETLWGEEHDYAAGVASGEIPDDAYLPVLYGAAETDDWKDPAVWRKANPNYGISLKPDFIEAAFAEALRKPSDQAKFRRYHLNLRTERAAQWMNMEAWDKCSGPADLIEGEKIWVGMDLSRRNDITALVALARRGKGFAVFPRFFIPEEGLEERERKDKVPFRRWVQAGLVTATPGTAIDYEFIKAEVFRWARAYKIQDVAYDPYGATQLAIELGKAAVPCTEIQQTMKHLSEPTKLLLLLVLEGLISHGGNPVLRWMAKNAKAVIDGNDNEKLMKNKSTGRIDGIVATIMALARATLGEDTTSIYETRGILQL